MNRIKPSCSKSRRGFVLVLVLVYLFLAAALLVMTTGSLAQLVGTTQREEVSIILRQLTDSASVWAERNGAARSGVDAVLDGSDLVPPGASAVVTLTPQAGGGEQGATLLIRAELGMRGRQYVRSVVLTSP